MKILKSTSSSIKEILGIIKCSGHEDNQQIENESLHTMNAINAQNGHSNSCLFFANFIDKAFAVAFVIVFVVIRCC